MGFLKIAGILLIAVPTSLCQVPHLDHGLAYADQCVGTDIGAQIETCSKLFPIDGNGYRSGTIVLPNANLEPAEIKWTTPVTLGPGINLQGQGLFASSFQCTVAGTKTEPKACLTYDASQAAGPNKHTVFPNSVYQGFAITGNGAIGQNIMYFKDAQGVTVRDVAADGASEAGGACFWFNNLNWWTERNTFINVSTMYGCNIGWRFTVQPENPNVSFGYNRFLDIKANPSGNQTAFSFESNSKIYNSTFRVTVNKDGVGSKVIHMQDSANFFENELHFFGEENGKGGYFFDITSPSNQFVYIGSINFCCGTANNIVSGATLTHWADEGGYNLISPTPATFINGVQAQGIPIPDASDLNNYVECGNYVGENLVNAPAPIGKNWARIEVICSTHNPSYVTQNVYIMAYTNSTPRMWQRVRDYGSWGAWREAAWTDQLPSGFSGVKNIGPCALTIKNGIIQNVSGC